MNGRALIVQGDALHLPLPDESIHAIVTDPPYGIRFMGKAWDGEEIRAAAHRDAATRKDLGPHAPSRPGRAAPRSSSAFGSPAGQAGNYDFSLSGNRAFQAWCEQWATEALRVLKPGGWLLSFGGTRTWHRLACAVEDAGFEMRDQIANFGPGGDATEASYGPLAWTYGSGFPLGQSPWTWARRSTRPLGHSGK